MKLYFMNFMISNRISHFYEESKFIFKCMFVNLTGKKKVV